VLDEKLAKLKGDAATMEPDAFAAAYRRFLTDVQHCL
jgi:hypothetical protein